jgi:hypothetical protein
MLCYAERFENIYWFWILRAISLCYCSYSIYRMAELLAAILAREFLIESTEAVSLD